MVFLDHHDPCVDLLFGVPEARQGHKWVIYSRLETPLQLLQKRYEAGRITHEEYEERRTRLLRIQI